MNAAVSRWVARRVFHRDDVGDVVRELEQRRRARPARPFDRDVVEHHRQIGGLRHLGVNARRARLATAGCSTASPTRSPHAPAAVDLLGELDRGAGVVASRRPAITGTDTASHTTRTSSICSSWVSVGLSPVVPARTSPSLPCSTNHDASLAAPSRSRAPSSVEGRDHRREYSSEPSHAASWGFPHAFFLPPFTQWCPAQPHCDEPFLRRRSGPGPEAARRVATRRPSDLDRTLAVAARPDSRRSRSPRR